MPHARALSVSAALLFATLAAAPARGDADLQAFKADAVDPIAAGGTQTYTITVINNGPDDAEFVTLADTLPAGTTFLSLSAPAGWTCTTPPVGSGGDVDCSTDLLAAFTAPAFTLQVVFDSGLANGTVVTNDATVSSETVEANPGDETGTTSSTVGDPIDADLTVAKTASPEPVLAGDDLTYTITVTNAGPADAADATMFDTLPAAVTFQSLSVPGGWSCTTPAVGSTGDVSCSVATMAPGTAVFTLVVQVVPSTPAGGILTNSVFVSSPTPDPVVNQSASVDSTVAAPALVSGTKTVSGTFLPASPVTYTVVLGNAGDIAQGDNSGDELTDVLPPAVTLVSATSTSGTAVANVGTNTVTWNGPVAAGGSVTITIQATLGAAVPPGTTVSNQGTIAYDGDADGTNEASALTDDPSVGGAADPTSFQVGSAPSPTEIPALDGWGLLLLLGLLAGAGMFWSRRL